jgi:DNA polymerase-3 subunit gamma/tau
VPGHRQSGEDDAEAQETARLAALLPPDETQLLYSMCLHGRTELGLAPDEYAALTMVLLRLLAFKPAAGGAEKKTALPVQAPEAPGPARQNVSHAEPLAAPTSEAPVVRETRNFDENGPLAQDAPALTATKVEANAEPVAAAPEQDPPALVEAPTTPQPAPAVLTVPVRELPEPGPRLQPRADAAPAALVPTPEGETWHGVVQQLIAADAVTALVRELALQSQLLARDGGHWLLRVERESLNQSGTRERLRAALEAAGLAQDISVELGPVSDSPALRNTARQNARQERALEVVQNDPFVQTLVREFDARIVPGSVLPL